MNTKKCQNCNNDFTPNTPKQVCCSRFCNAKKWRKLNPDKAKEQEKRSEAKRRGINRYNSEVRKAWYQKKKQDRDFIDKIRKQGNERAKKIRKYLQEYKLSKNSYMDQKKEIKQEKAEKNMRVFPSTLNLLNRLKEVTQINIAGYMYLAVKEKAIREGHQDIVTEIENS